MLERVLERHRSQDMGGLGEHAGVYDALTRFVVGPLFRRVVADVALLPLRPDDLLLDVGCGPGRLARLVAQAFPEIRVEGLDPSPAMVDRARQHAPVNATFQHGDVNRLPYDDGRVAAVVSTLSLHHWENPDDGLQEIERVLMVGGQAIIYDPAPSARSVTEAALAAGLQSRFDPLPLGMGRLTLRRLPST